MFGLVPKTGLATGLVDLMLFGLFKKSKGSAQAQSDDPWTFERLGDYWYVVNWLNEQHAAGQTDMAMEKYFRSLTDIIYASLDRYPQIIDELDKMVGGVYTDAEVAANCGMKLPPNSNLYQNMMKHGAIGRQFVDKIASRQGDAFRATWEAVIDKDNTYIQLLSKLVQDFGNFELLIVQLPGIQFPEKPGVQPLLHEMFEINTRLIRMLELIKDVREAWKKGKTCMGFFVPDTDMGILVKRMLLEYMIESDPQRIQKKKVDARRTGRPYKGYRFSRSADAFRQMSNITYGPPPKRVPKPNSPYVDVKVPAPTGPICADLKRLEWVLKEIFNNCIAATSIIKRTPKGTVVTPIEKHEGGEQSFAITLSAESFQKKAGWFRKEDWVRITLSDIGVGMDPYVTTNAHLWAFSLRRATFGKKSAAAAEALIIGGKGIGLAFSNALISQHGGTLAVTSEEGVRTDVVIELPTPTPFIK